MSWTIVSYSDYEKPKKEFTKKWPEEMRAVGATLAMVLQALASGVHPERLKLFRPRIHPEPSGILAITEHGCAKKTKPKAVRLYIFPDDVARVLHVMLLGDKSDQHRDIQLCKETVKKVLAARQPPTQTTTQNTPNK